MRFFLFISLLCCELFIVTALKANDPGVCPGKVSDRKTRNKVSVITKMCGKKKCSSRKMKVEHYTETKIKNLCCKGWEYLNKLDACRPLCSTGCAGGRCTEPELCQCDPPSILDPIHKNICIKPTCEPPCVNAECINNTCQCHQDYHIFNSTHCYRCEFGQRIDKEFKCIQNCTCTNGKCSKQDTCICDKGYKLVNKTCEPICENCVNSKCISPDLCECYEGFVKINEACVPKCSCENGRCNASNECECFEGYTKTNGVCEPICKDCTNGHCSAPDTCSCDDGFVKNETSDKCSKLYPKNCKACDEEGICVSGCVPKESPGLRGKHSKRLVCCEHWEYDKDKKICKPQCLYSCGDAKCIAPNKCGCDPPLLYINKTCIPPPPKCDLQCINATCTFNNTCTCLAGHMHRDDYTCVPECSKSCINGDCVAPDTCHCHEGYKNKNAFECEPICNDCQNGVCVAPNTCTCDVGYVRQGGRCVPKCDYECINGFCSEPNTCTCHRGYEIDLSNGYTCRPMCDRECINATCSSPNTCKCLTGYMHANASVCKPLCESCINGECVAPNVCKCNNGYHMINGICEPYCSRPCLNGYCSGPESCTCDKGYELDNDNYTCRAVCSPKCINATCESPDRCKCFDGFIESSSFVCKPICSSCEHGKCISPTICMCNKGYNMIHGSCKPVCHHECVNGFCSRPNLCTCHDGYTRNSTHPSICSKSCIGCDNGTCIDGECTCKPGFNYINSTCTPMIVECNSCSSNCTNGECRCTDGGPCTFVVTPQRFNTVDSSTVTHVNTMAGLELSWLLGSCVSIVLLTGVIIIIGHMWRRQRDYETKEGTKIANPYGSVAYTVAGTLKNRNYDSDKIPNLYGDVDYYDEQDDDNETKEIRNELLTPHIVVDK